MSFFPPLHCGQKKGRNQNIFARHQPWFKFSTESTDLYYSATYCYLHKDCYCTWSPVWVLVSHVGQGCPHRCIGCGPVLTLPYLTFGVGRLLHLPSAEAVSVRPNVQPRCNQKVTVIGCEAEQITSHLGLVTCSMVVPIRRSALG